MMAILWSAIINLNNMFFENEPFYKIHKFNFEKDLSTILNRKITFYPLLGIHNSSQVRIPQCEVTEYGHQCYKGY